MSAGIFKEIENRISYVSEVHSLVTEILTEFTERTALHGGNVAIKTDAPDLAGATLTLTQQGAEPSSIYAEINTAGDVRISRRNPDSGSLREIDSETRFLDFSQPPIASATDIVLALAQDHRGYVGAVLEAYLAQEFKPNAETSHAP